MMKQYASIAFVVLFVAFQCVAVRGLELAPGESARLEEIYYDGPLASDELIASRSTPFTLIGFDDDTQTPRVFSGGFNNQVYRSTIDGTLSFRYGASGSDTAGRVVDLEGMWVSGFGLFRTDVQVTQMTGLSRSADGDTIRTGYTGTTSRGLFVRTNATAFAEDGEFQYHVSFQPGDGDATAVFAAFRPVPEPAGVVPVLGFSALMLRRRLLR